jgi:predicted secreted protein
MKKFFALLLLCFVTVFASFGAHAETPNLLDGVVDKYFKGKSLTKTDDITFDVAKRALDGTQVPFKFTANKKYKNISVVVEGNPHQLPGIGSLALTMHPKVAPFTFETHIRMEQDSYVDVIAEDENGKFFYNQVAIRSAGGCSAGVTYDADAVLKEVGNMKILNTDNRASIFIKHPQHNGYQANLSNYTGLFILPEWHLSSVSVTDDEKEIWSAEFGGGSTAENPFFIFDTQKIKGDLKVVAVDSQGKQYLSKKSLLN